MTGKGLVMTPELQAYITKLVDEAPPLAPWQTNQLALLLNGGSSNAGPLRRVSDEQLAERRREAEERRRRDEAERKLKKLERDMWRCGVCGVPKGGHMAASSATHGWEPRDPEALLKRYGGNR